MANQLLSTRIVNSADNFSSYIAGDKIEVFYDDTNDVFVVKKNDGTITSGDTFASASLVAGDFSFTKTGYGFCVSTARVDYITLKIASFPYARKRVSEGHPDCAAAQSDIEKAGPPVVVPASAADTKDATITVKASSSAVVRFATVTNDVADDFITPFIFTTEGTAADSVSNSVYTVTLTVYPGIYNVAALDSVGGFKFWTRVSVGIDESAAYATRFFFSYKQRQTKKTRKVLIKQLNYTGGASDVIHSGSNPVQQGWGAAGKTNKGTTILGGWMKVSFISSTTNEFTTLFASVSEREWLVELYNDPDGSNTLIQRGFVIPANYREPLMSAPYEISLDVTDGLADLQDKEYLTDKIEIIGGVDPFSQLAGLSLNGNASLIEILSFCLSKTGTTNGLRTAMNTYHTKSGDAHASTAADDPLFQTYLNQSTFYENGLPFDCRTVIERILQALPEPCRMFSSGGYFYVIPNDNIGASLAYREYDKAGAYVTNSTLTPIIDLGQWDDTNRPVLKPGAGVTLATVYNKIRITQVRNIVDNLVNDFNRLTLDGDGFLGWQNVKNGDAGGWSTLSPSETQRVVRVVPTVGGRDRDSAGGNRGSFDASNNNILDDNESFSLQFNFKDGQGANAYTVASSGTIQYKSLDSFIFSFTVFFDPAQRRSGAFNTEWPYVPLKWMLKVGSKYFTYDGTWSSTVTINKHFLVDFNKESTIDIQGFFDSTVTTNTTTTFEIRVYDVDVYQYDIEGTSAANMESQIAALLTSTRSPPRPAGTRLIARYDGGDNDYTTIYYELQEDNSSIGAFEGFLRFEAGDDSTYKWRVISIIEPFNPTTASVNSDYRINNVSFLTFPDNVRIEDTFTEDKVVSTENAKTLDYDLHHFDIDNTLNNAEQLILNFFKLANGNPTSQWGTSSKKTQDLVADALLKRYKLPTRIINFDLVSDIEITPFNVIRKVNDDNRIFQFNRLTINDKRSEYQGELEEISSDTGAAAGANKAFDSGFDTGFS